MYESIIQSAAVKYGVPVTWIQAVIEVESSWRPNVHPEGDGYGLMQVLESTARGLGFTGDVAQLFDPMINIDLGTKLLAELRTRFGNDFQRVYSAYNSGKPDLYLTSSQVAANVARAVLALTKWTNQAISNLTGSPIGDAIVMVLVGMMLLQWVRKK